MEDGMRGEGPDNAPKWWSCCIMPQTSSRRSVSFSCLSRSESVGSEEQGKSLWLKLPDELWLKIVGHLDDSHMYGFAVTCKHFKLLQQESGRKLETKARDLYSVEMPLSEEWCMWHSRRSPKSEFYRTIMIDAAAKRGYLNVIKFWRQQKLSKRNGIFFNEWTCANAAQGGHIEILQWLRSEGCPWDEQTCAAAAYKGQLHCLQWLREQGCPWSEDTCACAAGGGHLHVLQWARGSEQAEPCPWNEKTCTCAAQGGHLDVLKWLRSEDPPCPWNWMTCAAAKNNVELLHWMRDNGCPGIGSLRVFE
ncbi:hypothetical protein HOP50_12g66800 [Chloropicon primus]|uniref:F-box domain-containing protein n=1 Tax=Chloropicon primus TaxID=1764295 RepID=A0A5B8MX34_9CHLO|nr:hypothetical protein A3770_12p66600 [Chloropicon primus]UPR03351.1 hypothetical protein HOP50_12g66800 [Chloropicon primus]|mmetsp:Transcript_14376/g.40898  ORF Transcript_14376/g.40898 Transcript_14376/m.40898 type:complete len:306 (+) Transcript_14376:421-1338(+)|eukprot:QDZ24142.1 hypothetical protein A3770_12p66600 [Chloropicon primus]